MRLPLIDPLVLALQRLCALHQLFALLWVVITSLLLIYLFRRATALAPARRLQSTAYSILFVAAGLGGVSVLFDRDLSTGLLAGDTIVPWQDYPGRGDQTGTWRIDERLIDEARDSACLLLKNDELYPANWNWLERRVALANLQDITLHIDQRKESKADKNEPGERTESGVTLACASPNSNPGLRRICLYAESIREHAFIRYELGREGQKIFLAFLLIHEAAHLPLIYEGIGRPSVDHGLHAGLEGWLHVFAYNSTKTHFASGDAKKAALAEFHRARGQCLSYRNASSVVEGEPVGPPRWGVPSVLACGREGQDGCCR